MSIYGGSINAVSLKSLLQRTSTKIQSMYSEIKSVQTVLSQIADADLKAIIAEGEGVDLVLNPTGVDTQFAQVRDWQYQVSQWADNYKGTGGVSDVSYHVAKRVSL